MKKVCCFLIATVCILLAACAPTKNIVVANEKYVIYTENSNYYILLKDTAKINVGEIGFISLPSVRFDSLAEMKSDIATGNFTDAEWLEFNLWYNINPSRKICDINQLFAPICPESFNAYTVEWKFTFYVFHMEDTNSGINVEVRSLRQEVFERCIAEMQNWPETLVSDAYVDTAEDVRTEHEAERNAMVYYWDTHSDNGNKECIYTIEKDGQIFYVYEQYSLSEGDGELSAEVPQAVSVYGECNGQYYSVEGSGFTERPSIEWLTSFGMVPYVED